MAFQDLSCGTRGAKKRDNCGTKTEEKEGGSGRTERWSSWEVSTGVMTRRGASTKVCPPQHESGDDSHPSRLDESQGYLFFFPLLTHTADITDILMRLKSTGCHTCIQGGKPTTC